MNLGVFGEFRRDKILSDQSTYVYYKLTTGHIDCANLLGLLVPRLSRVQRQFVFLPKACPRRYCPSLPPHSCDVYAF